VNARGFSLLETLVAVSIAAVALSALAYLFVIAVQANADARRATFASVLAAQKMEQLRGLGDDLSPQASGSLSQNVAGLCDFLDEYGRSLAGGLTPPSGTVYIRRWSIESVASGPADTLLVQVVVIRRMWRGGVNVAASDQRLLGGAQVVTLKTRRVP